MSIASHGLEEGSDYELTIGSSFLTGKAKEAYHLMRYDFKPASIDTGRPAEFVVGENNQCTVTIPNIQESGNTTTTYKGGKKPCTKECVLIIDKETGQITLERITSSIPLKKCRADKSEKKAIVQSKPSKEPNSQNSSKTSKSTLSNSMPSASSTLNSAPSSTPTPASAIHNPINSTGSSNVQASTVAANSSSKINTNPLNASATIPKKRLMSDMSVSSTSDSDSSDSDSADEEEDPLANQLESIATGNASSKSSTQAPKSVNGLHKTANQPPKPSNSLAKSSSSSLKTVSSVSKPGNQASKSTAPTPKPPNPPSKPPNQVSKTANQMPKTERLPAKMEAIIKTDRSPVKMAPVKTKEKAFLSTLQSDLQLSDSSDSD